MGNTTKQDPNIQIENAVKAIEAAADECYSSEKAIRAILGGTVSVSDRSSTKPRMPRADMSLGDIVGKYLIDDTPSSQEDVSAETLARMDRLQITATRVGNVIKTEKIGTFTFKDGDVQSLETVLNEAMDRHVKSLNNGNFITRHPIFSTISAGIIVSGIAYGASEDFRDVVAPYVQPAVTKIQETIEYMQDSFALSFPDIRP